MKLLLDTHLLLWAAAQPDKLSSVARDHIMDPENKIVFSVASLWEIAIKANLKRPDFEIDALLLRRTCLASDYIELPVLGTHAVMIGSLPPIHKDPFDRLLLAQAIAEKVVLLTADTMLARYSGPIWTV